MARRRRNQGGSGKLDWRESPLAWFARLLWAQELRDRTMRDEALRELRRLGFDVRFRDSELRRGERNA